MSDVQQLLDSYAAGVHFAEASGFEVLELLDVRSRLAVREAELDDAQRAHLEAADRVFFNYAPCFQRSIAAVGDWEELRRRAAAPASHWWWHLDKMIESYQAAEVEPMAA